MKIVIGVDPDSVKNAVAIYKDGELKELDEWDLNRFLIFIAMNHDDLENIQFSIEDVASQNFIYSRNRNKNRKVENDIARKLGRNQQAQIELMRILDYRNIKYVLHKPTRNNWADDKCKFEKLTGWIKRSNKDTRSAAYFGYLALR